MKLTDIIKQLDLFGYPVQFVYEDDKIRQRSWFGGLITLLLMMGIIHQAIEGSQKLNHHANTRILQNNAVLDLSTVGKIKYEDTKMMIFHVIRKGNKYDFT